MLKKYSFFEAVLSNSHNITDYNYLQVIRGNSVVMIEALEPVAKSQ